MKKLTIVSLVLLISMLMTACGPKVEPFECTDEWGCVTIAPGDPVRIAYALVISGPNESLGVACVHGVEIAAGDKGELLGHPIEIVGEDSLCSAEGGQTAVTKLVSDPSLLGIIGPNCSSAGVPASKIAADANVVMISPSNTAPSLTAPDMHEKTYLRSCHNDNVQGKAMATFVYNELGLRTAATIHDGSPYADQLQQVFADSFVELGGTITAQEAVNTGDTDMRPILTTIAADSPELLYYPIFIAEGGFISVQAQEIAGLENTVLAVVDGCMSPDFIEAAGDASEGMYASGPDLSFENDLAVHFMEVHREQYGGDPTSVFYAHAYDGTNMLFAAIEKVATQDEDGTLHVGRKAMNDAVFATSNFEGITGVLTCNEYGDCADPKIAVNKITGGEYVPIWTY
ncbi:MAG TPA: ABC transporter substrate-binding protein [Thermoflexia bacterium]|nr:ABC transporter substrate-binding protein [Thermoflexia bacterium]